MRDALDKHLQALLTQLLAMGGLAERMIGDAAAGLLDANEEAIARVFAVEAELDALHTALDREAVTTVVKQQPVASDVRLIFAVSRAANDLERVGDCAVNICQSAGFVHDGDVAPPAALRELFELVRHAVGDALAALISRDVEQARAVVAADQRINALRDSLFRDLLREMIRDPITAGAQLSLVLVSRNLERIGDHATNLAEDVIYMVRGEDVRHGGMAEANRRGNNRPR